MLFFFNFDYRLVASEDVQYFQFDAIGNMFVYCPGSGFSGVSKLVRPGEDLNVIWSDSEENEQDHTESQASLSETGLAVGSTQRSYYSPLPSHKMEELSHKKFSPETMKKINWVVKMYREWRIYRNSQDLEDKIDCDLDEMATVSEESLIFAVSRFITEVKKLDGSDFPGKTLYDIVICIQFHLETKGYAWRLLSNDLFKDIKFTLDNMMKLRTSQGIGVSVKRAQVLSFSDEDLLWSLGLLGTHHPDVLLNTCVFLIGKGCALRARKEHHCLRSPPFRSQFQFLHDTEGQIFMQYSEEVGYKTNKGGLKHRKI